MRRWFMVVAIGLLHVGVVHAQPPTDARELGIKYVRDSEEYAALTRQTYRLATDAVERTSQGSRGQPWAVILDIDETVLDNSVYELERAAYRLPFDLSSWNAWALRHAAGLVPGALSFITAVRQAGGHVAWISNRDARTSDATRVNLQSVAVWSDDDRLCLQDRAERTKSQRRAEVLSGTGACAWVDVPMRVIAFIGDQMGDFPAAGERIAGAESDAAFGRTCFLLPNSMYGQWTMRVTREPAH